MGLFFTADFISITTLGTTLNNLKPLTISAWINPTATTLTGTGAFFSKGTHGNLLAFYVESSGMLGFRKDFGGGQLIQRRTSVNSCNTDGIYKHVAVTWTGLSSVGIAVAIYIGGSESTYSVNSTNATGAITSDATQISRIGRVQINSYYKGELCELAIWNTTLSTAEIRLLASSRVSRTPLMVRNDKLVAYWPLDNYANATSADGTYFVNNLTKNPDLNGDLQVNIFVKSPNFLSYM